MPDWSTLILCKGVRKTGGKEADSKEGREEVKDPVLSPLASPHPFVLLRARQFGGQV